MAKKRNYSGYESFDYLAKKDWEEFELAKEIGWGNATPYEIPLTADETERLERILDKAIVISLHEHLVRLPKDVSQTIPYVREGRVVTAYKALTGSYVDAVMDNGSMFFMHGRTRQGWTWEETVFDIGMRLCDIDHQDFLIQCKKVDDIIRAHNEGKIAFIPSFESCTPIGNQIELLDVLYGLGVRMMGITFSEANMLGTGLKEKFDGGLTALGYQVVERLNKLGMAIDIAHVGDQTSLDVIEASEKPVFFSHAGARAVWNSKRMKPDKVIKACAEKGGIIGISAAPDTTLSILQPAQGIDSIMDHFKYCVDLVGIDHVSFGPDTMYGDHLGLQHVISKSLSKDAFMSGDEYEKTEYVKGFENPTEATNNILRWLVKNGYSDEDIIKVVGGNTLRVLREVWI